MASSNSLDDSQIGALLEELDNESISSDQGSETEDVVLEDNVQSDFEDQFVDSPNESMTVSETPDTTTSDGCIITDSVPTLRSKSGHCWSTTKGTSSSRYAMINIVRTARGPTRQNKSFYEPLECFNIFFYG